MSDKLKHALDVILSPGFGKPQANDSERSPNQPAGEVLKSLDENAFGIALQAAMQTVTSGQYSSDADLRAAEIEHDRQYATTLISSEPGSGPNIPNLTIRRGT